MIKLLIFVNQCCGLKVSKVIKNAKVRSHIFSIQSTNANDSAFMCIFNYRYKMIFVYCVMYCEYAKHRLEKLFNKIFVFCCKLEYFILLMIIKIKQKMHQTQLL